MNEIEIDEYQQFLSGLCNSELKAIRKEVNQKVVLIRQELKMSETAIKEGHEERC